jgi:cytoskeletal protein RodZ
MTKDNSNSRVPVVLQEHDRKAKIVTAITFLVTLFLLFFIKYQEPDPPRRTIPIPMSLADEGISNFEVHAGGGGSAGGEVNEVPEQETPSAPEQPTQETSEVTTQTGSSTGSSSQATTTINRPSNPFAGSGSGSGQGSSSGFGPDDGPGQGAGQPGRGGGGDRIRKSNMTSQPKTPNSQAGTIALKLIVDASGNVVSASFIRDQSSIQNQTLINEVIELVRREVKYNEKPGAANEIVYYTARVNPT